VIFAIGFASFVFGLNSLYWYYDKEVRRAVEIGHEHPPTDKELSTHAEEAFGSLGKTLMTLFFALYTIGETTDTIIDGYSNFTTVTFGYFLFATFHVANITIMINMLIAMMTKSYEDTIVSLIF
jgi:transient receptor potential cation channel subfamily C protein 4